MKQYLSSNARYFVSMLVIGLLILIAQWQSEIFESNTESIGFMSDWFDGGLVLFFQDWSSFISFIAILIAASIPAFVLFRSQSQVFARRYVNFIVAWFVIEIAFVAYFALPQEVIGDSYYLVNTIETVWGVLPFVVGYIMLCIWFGYSIANIAAKKGKSWDSFFWLTLLLGPVIMWFIVSLLSAEEEHARGKVRGSSTWADSRTKVLFASHGSIARIAVIVPATLITLDAIVLFGYQNFIDPSSAQIISAVEEWSDFILLVEVLGFTYLMLNVNINNSLSIFTAFWRSPLKTMKTWPPRVLIISAIAGVVAIIAIIVFSSIAVGEISKANKCSGETYIEACQTVQDAEEFLNSLDSNSPKREKIEGLLESLKHWVEDKGTPSVIDVVTMRLQEEIGK